MTCKENIYDLVTELTAYPEASVTFGLPMQVERKTIASSDITPDEAQSIRIPMKPKSGKVSESVQQDIHGTSYKDTVEWEMNDPSQADIEKVTRITRTPHHLKVTIFGGGTYWIRKCGEAVSGGYVQDTEGFRVSLTIVSRNGMQLLSS